MMIIVTTTTTIIIITTTTTIIIIIIMHNRESQPTAFRTDPHSCWSSAHFAAADQGEVDTDPATRDAVKCRKHPLVMCAIYNHGKYTLRGKPLKS